MNSPQQHKLVVVLDDEPDIAELVSLHLKNNGFQAREFHDPGPFIKFLKNTVPDLVILDLMLPGTDGFELCKHIKNDSRLSQVPVIMLTAKNDVTDKVLGLELGADDYITKPFSPKELVARVKAVLRRNKQKDGSGRLEIGNAVCIDPEKFEVTVSGKRVELTSTEFKILELLSSKKGYVFTREKILDALWGQDKIVVDRTIDVHVKHLREKLGNSGSMIKSVRGIGYKLEE